MKKVTVHNPTDRERALLGVNLLPGATSDELTLQDYEVELLAGSTFDVKVLGDVEEQAAAPELRGEQDSRQSHLADAHAFALAQSAEGDVNAVDLTDEQSLDGDAVAKHYSLDEEVVARVLTTGADTSTPDSAGEAANEGDQGNAAAGDAANAERKPAAFLGRAGTTGGDTNADKTGNADANVENK